MKVENLRPVLTYPICRNLICCIKKAEVADRYDKYNCIGTEYLCFTSVKKWYDGTVTSG